MKLASRGTLLRVAVSVGLLAILFGYIVDPREVAGQLRLAARRPGPMLAAVVLYCVLGSVARGYRWRALIIALGHPISIGRASEMFLVGTFFNQFLPTAIGGDVIRALMVAQDGLGRARAASSVIVDRAVGLLPQFALGLVALAVARDHATTPVASTLLAAGIAGVAGLVALFKAGTWGAHAARLPAVGRVWGHPGVTRFVGSFDDYRPAALLTSAGWGFAFAFLLVGANATLGRAVGIDQMRLLDWAIFVPLVALSTLLPSIGGWGVREVLYVGLLGTLSPPVAKADATALSLLFGALNLVLAAIGGALLAAGPGAGVPRAGWLIRQARSER